MDTFSSSAHGFRKGRSIVTNAKHHVRKTLVLKVDIKDFFPSITFKRLKAMLMKQPFGYPAEVAIAIAKLCIYQGALPQGSPMSPFLSNMFMRKTDTILRRYAKEHRISYTRYADDLTFSTTALSFPANLVSSPTATSGLINKGFLDSTLSRAGFEINEKKTRLLDRKRRMCVTGVVVNRRSNVTRDYIRRIRVLTHLIERHGPEKANEYFLERLDERAHLRKEKDGAILSVVRGRIAHVAQVRGKDDLLVRSLQDRLAKALGIETSSSFVGFRSQWSELRAEKNGSVRGYMLERLWTALAEHEGIRVLSSYRTTGEQIDGMIEINGRFFLVELKAGGEPTPTRDLDTFVGKLNRRPEGTVGLFISLAGYVEHAPQLVKEYRTKSIVLMSAAHLESVLAQKISLPDLIARAWSAFISHRIVLLDPYEHDGYKVLNQNP